MTASTQNYRRDLNLNLTVSFHPGSRVSALRLEALQAAVENALAESMKQEIPNATADVHSQMQWTYVFKEAEGLYLMGEEAENPVIVPDEADDDDEKLLDKSA